MDYMNDLHELCETISREIGDANEKIRAAGGKLSGGDYDTIDKLTHSLKSIKATIAMMEDEDGYSNRAYPMGGSYRYSRDGSSYRDGMGGSYRSRDGRSMNRNGGSYRSYARGRMNARRDSMGRYSGADGDVEDIKRDVMELAEKVKSM